MTDSSMPIYDEDLRAFGGFVSRLPPASDVQIGHGVMAAGELAAVFRDAIAYRTSRPAPDPLRRAAKDCAPHIPAWIALLEAYVETLPLDHAGGDCDAARSYALHELRAMKRDLGALAEALVVTA